MINSFRPQTPKERTLILRLLKDERAPFALARKFVESDQVRKVDSFGSLRFGKINGENVIERKPRWSLPLLGVAHDSDDVPVQYTLFVDDDGFLAELEIYRLDGRPIRSDAYELAIVLKEDKPGTLL